MKNKIILCIDPGYGLTGFGVIECYGQKAACLDYGVIKTSGKASFSQRLKELHIDLKKIIRKYRPACLAVEKLFFFKNLKTAIDVAQASGVVVLTAIENNIPILEFTPLQVKQSICGYGKAEKQQIQKMVKMILNLQELPRPDDAADALAIALMAMNKNR